MVVESKGRNAGWNRCCTAVLLEAADIILISEFHSISTRSPQRGQAREAAGYTGTVVRWFAEGDATKNTAKRYKALWKAGEFGYRRNR